MTNAALSSPVDPEDRLQALRLEGVVFQDETGGLCWTRKVGMTSMCGQHRHVRASCSLCSIHSRAGSLGQRAGPAAEATLLLGVCHCCWFLAGEHPAWGPTRPRAAAEMRSMAFVGKPGNQGGGDGHPGAAGVERASPNLPPAGTFVPCFVSLSSLCSVLPLAG